jgi:uncharacterized protein YbjQ (UPF0145 family)
MIQLYVFVVLVIVGYFIGHRQEKKHYASIEQRELTMLNLVTTNSKRPIGTLPPIREVRLVNGSVVISVDFFKRLLATLRNFFGGNVLSYETLLDRARREAILRLKESCPGAYQIINLRIETSSISQGGNNKIGSVEVLAYATAIYTIRD